MPQHPRIFWVIAPATSAGKSEVCAALLRVLGAAGRRTLPFKPWSGVNLFQSINSLSRWPSGRQSSGDTARIIPLATALADEDPVDMVDVCNPIRMMFFHDPREIVMVREGSQRLGTERFYRGPSPAGAVDRPDIRALLEDQGLWEKMGTLPDPDTHVLTAHRVFPQATAAAWNHLAGYQPDDVVVEGSSKYLPIWRGQPVPDGMFVLRHGWIDLFSGIDARVLEVQKQPTSPTGADLDRFGASLAQRMSRAYWPIFPSSKRAAGTDAVIRELLDKSGMLSAGAPS